MLNYINGKGVMNMKQKVILVCSECLSRNYSVTKNKRLNVERLELRKYCKKCGKHRNKYDFTNNEFSTSR